jgi:hypothetical protein
MTGRFRFNDPDDLGNLSTAVLVLFLQMRSLDFARRYYQRLDDSKSKRRSSEIKKLLHQIGDLTHQGIFAYVPFDVMEKQFEVDKFCKDKNSETSKL